MTNDLLISFYSSVWLAEGKTRRGGRKWKKRGQEGKDGWSDDLQGNNFSSRPPTKRRSVMKKRSYVCTRPLTSHVTPNWCINFLSSGSVYSTFFSRLCPCPLLFFLFLFPRCIITVFIQPCQGSPSVWSLFAALLLPFFPCFPLFALLYHPPDTSVLPLNLNSPYFSSPLFPRPALPCFDSDRNFSDGYWHYSVHLFFELLQLEVKCISE